jgi:hypothetical protein
MCGGRVDRSWRRWYKPAPARWGRFTFGPRSHRRALTVRPGFSIGVKMEGEVVGDPMDNASVNVGSVSFAGPDSKRARGLWPVGLIGMLGLVLGVERYVARHDARFTTVHAADWRHSGQSVPRAVGCDLVGFGDSLVKFGLVPQVLELRLGTGRRAYNLAVPQGQAPAHYFLLRRLLRAGARPSAVLVDGEMLVEKPLDNARVWPELASLRECAELAWEARDANVLATMVLARLLPSYKARHEIRLSVTSALKGKLPDEPRALPVIARNWNRNAGAQLLPPRNDPPGQDPRPAELERAGYRPTQWRCDPLNATYVKRFLDLAMARGIPVFWLLPPYHPEVQARRARYGWDGQYMAFLRNLQARYPSLTVIDGRNAGYPADVLADMTHLDRTGAIAFSDAVGGLLRDRLAGIGSRWVEIPGYDAGAAMVLAAASPVEDIKQSGRALERVMIEERRKRGERRLARSLQRGEQPRR